MRRTHPSPSYIRNAIYKALTELQRELQGSGAAFPPGIYEAVDEGICKANLEHDERMERTEK